MATEYDETLEAIAGSGLRPILRSMLLALMAFADRDASPVVARVSAGELQEATGYAGTGGYLRTLELGGYIRPVDDGFELHMPAPGRPYRWSGKVSPTRRRRIYDRDGHRCVKCGSSNDLTIDHIRPRRYGGSNDDANLRTLCRTCNSKKGDRVE